MLKTEIVAVAGRRVWDSRGLPTVEVEISLPDGIKGRAIAPAGASTGSGEAVDLRDGGTSLFGKDVRRAVANVNGEIRAALIGLDVCHQQQLDEVLWRLDGTPNKSRLGGNALIATSMAALHARAAAEKVPLWRCLAGERKVRLPLPEIQIFGGGAHAGGRVDIQDFMVICPGASSFAEALDWTAAIYHSAAQCLSSRKLLAGVADEGGFWPCFERNEEALEILTEAIEKAGFTPGGEVAISLDVAATQFSHHQGGYTLALEGRKMDSDGLIAMLEKWIEKFPIWMVEDPLAENDEEGLKEFTRRLGSKLQIIGDDYLVTDSKRIAEAAALPACNAVLIKPNQAGTITETQKAWEESRNQRFGAILSARSGETEDLTIVHLAAGWGLRQLKVGSFSRSERMAKWNEGLRIEEEVGGGWTPIRSREEFVSWTRD